ncbi:hypothetical protein R1917_10250 [Citrobacter koseri]|uniref:hypothetical protein n=1 Tax=Citrobacter koseri TaxID=545 RepID=UPI002942F9CD|nr:hypothetical protein [Citrobacter koseri]WOJ32683.1 hypothetical protein R1917_10250 [Citrobacter koseri]WOJ36856.1 hypothetical protein R1243_07795 [Citrobacter koseri]
MAVYLLLVLTYSTGRLEHVPFYTEQSCLAAAEKLRLGMSRNFGFVECVKNEAPNG